ncbi:endolytic transglycosylase MltG [Microbacterium karelineae]|uniref:endolytic transglycosylase MltG n=1 Tax=Microbacterium karelineae TaxID=2654283 RepID=UPI0012E9E537|nr:endolytic transglycosylase MltG [Microbacterium karelineae]
MTQPDSPQGRPLTRREMRDLRARQATAEAQQEAPSAAPAETQSSPERGGAEARGHDEAIAGGADVPRDGAAPSAPAAQADPVGASPTASARDERRGAPTRGDSLGAAPASAASTDATLHDLLEGHHDDDHHAPKKRKRRGGGCLAALIIVLVIVGGIVGAGVWAVNTYGQDLADRFGISLFGIEPTPTDYEAGLATGEATITITAGDTGWEVSQALHEADVTLTESVFYDMLVAAQVDPEFMPGTYQLQQKMTAKAALEALEDPESKLEDAVAYPEGFTLEQIAPRIAVGLDVDEAFVDAALEDPSEYGVDADSLEGWLFPASYQFEPGTAPRAAIAQMVERTRESLDAAGVPDAQAQRVLTIASIIQREARYEDDFYRVSAVIANRLDESISETGGLLQMDSTAQYGYGEMHEGQASSSEEALNDDNPWNTYVHAGLPAGPISNPGDLAIDAAMHPAEGSWQFFVTVNLDTGETVFSDTYAEHETHVAEWTAWCRANPDSGC